MQLKCHMPKLFNVHWWGKYASIYATYELTAIKHEVISKISKNQCLQDHHIFVKQKSFKHILSRLPHPPKVRIVQISPCKMTTCYPSK